jgi:hypothetical protein
MAGVPKVKGYVQQNNNNNNMFFPPVLQQFLF